MPQDNKKLVSQIEGLYDKFLLELQELEKKRQEILAVQKSEIQNPKSETNYKLQ